MGKVLCGLLLTVFVKMMGSQLIRSSDIYKGVIRDVCDYYECFSITLFYSGSPRTQDIDMITKLMNLSKYFERELLIRTTVTDVSSYATQFSSARLRLMVKPLFVLLNDSDDMKVQFATMLAPLMDISKPMWTIFMRDETSIEDFFEDVYIPFDCKFMASKKHHDVEGSEVIVEIYRVYYGKPLKQDSFTAWNNSTGIDPPSLTFNQRRINLDQINLRVSLINYPPATIIERDKHGQMIKIVGFCSKIIKELQRKLNFSVTYQIAPSVGRPLPNGTWSGGLGLLLRNESDLFMTNIQIISHQTQLLDYTTPLYKVEYRFYMKKSSRVILYWDRFFRPFQPEIWFLVGFLWLTGSVIVSIIQFLERKVIVKDTTSNDGSSSPLYTLLSVFGAFCNQGMGSCRLSSLQLVQFTIHATAIIILSAYSARLISALTTLSSGNYFTTTNELLDDQSYKLTIVNGSADYLLFQNTSSKLLKRVFERTMKYEKYFSANRFQGLQRACNNENFAFMAGQVSVGHFKMVNCTLMTLDTIVSAPMSMALQHNSPFRRAVNHQLNLMRETGVLDKLLKNLTVIVDKDDAIWEAVELIDIIALIALLMASFITSMLLLLGEKIFSTKSAQKPKVQQRLIVKVKPMIHQKGIVLSKDKKIYGSQKLKKKPTTTAKVINAKNQVRGRKFKVFDEFQHHTKFSVNINSEKKQYFFK